MLTLVDKKVRQLHAALDNLVDDDIDQVKPEVHRDRHGFYMGIDFNSGVSQAQLDNIATLVVANVARLKDHLNVWLHHKGEPRTGDDVIRENRAVAVIHDLWNTDKHGLLDRRTRAGFRPEIRDLHRAMHISSEGGAAYFSMNPETGQMDRHVSGDASMTLEIDGVIWDLDADARYAGFVETAEAAVAAWEAALVAAGLTIPGR